MTKTRLAFGAIALVALAACGTADAKTLDTTVENKPTTTVAIEAAPVSDSIDTCFAYLDVMAALSYEAGDILDAEFDVASLTAAATQMRGVVASARAQTPPTRYIPMHAKFIEATDLWAASLTLSAEAVVTMDVVTMDTAIELMEEGTVKTGEAEALLNVAGSCSG